MAKTIAKTVTLTDGSTELEVPATRWKVTRTNDITSFARPKQDGGEPERRALNLNRIQEKVQVGASITDAFADKNHNGNGSRPDISNKEEWLKQVRDFFISGNLVTVKATNNNTNADTSTIEGYIHNFDNEEMAKDDNSFYDVTLNIVDEVEMNS